MAGERFGDIDIANYGSANISQGGTQNITAGDPSRHFAGQREADGGPRRRGDATSPVEAAEFPADRSRNVFVVYGRDEQARQAVFGLLRRLDLRPLEWEPIVRAGGAGTPFLGQVVADAPARAQAAVVILTPDDIVMLHPELRSAREDRFELHPALQPRPNVLIELGIVLAVYPENTIIIEFGELRPIADLAGRNVIRFHEATSAAEAVRKIAGRLEQAGCPVDDKGADWLDPGPFTGMRSYWRKPP
jgi:predicted nucleotide-binding protein